MLTKRIIPCLDIKDGRTVKGTKFAHLRDAGNPVELAARYSDEGADELVFLDISASQEDRGTLVDLVERVAEAIQIPFTVGGGVATVSDIAAVLGAGADKVSLNSAIVQRPELMDEAARFIGSQSLVAAIDAKCTGSCWTVWIRGGTQATDKDAIAWAREIVDRGAGELLVTSMDRDGTAEGYDVELLRRMTDAVSVPVIASGGAGTKEHFREAITRGNADALLAATLFHYRHVTIPELKSYLSQQNIPVRQ